MREKGMELREKLKGLPELPGVYIFRDASGEVIYVGKANSLRSRVSSYFQSRDLSTKTMLLVQAASDVEYILVDSEEEAFVLESNLIKKHRPRYNVLLKDDKRYPMLKITMQDEYPCIARCRKMDDDGALYFGPFTDSIAVNRVIGIVKRHFGVRTCRKIQAKGCVKCRIGACAGPCIKLVSKEEYRQRCAQAARFLGGDRKAIEGSLKEKMRIASEKKEYEAAAAYRDQLLAVSGTYQQKISEPGNLEADIVFIACEGAACVAEVLFVREGRVSGHAALPLSASEGSDDEERYSSFIKQFYLNSFDLPGEIVLPVELSEKKELEAWLGGRKSEPVDIITPKAGRLKALLEMAEKNASFAIRFEKAKEGKKSALLALKEALSLRELPVRIEAFDISNIQGNLAVGSMVVFEDAEPAKSEYRRFRIKGVEGANDPAMMLEVLSRRYARKENIPSLVLVDGGPAQANAGRSALERIGLDLPIVGLAKRLEELYLPGNAGPIILAKESPALLLLQALRDEAHRFAVSYHRALRSKGMKGSELDGIPGLGPKKKGLLLKRFGSVDGVKKASLSDLEKEIGKEAANVFRHLKSKPA